MAARPCKACGMDIEFIEGPSGRDIPAQKIRTVYFLVRGRLEKYESQGRVPIYVSHFETCPQANLFSKKRGEKT